MKTTRRRSSGHARAEIRRRYAIAWAEYIDLSRRPPRSHRRLFPSLSLPLSFYLSRRRYYRCLWISLRHFQLARPTLSSIVEILVSRPRARAVLQLRFTPIGVPFDIRAEHYCPWYWRCRPCYVRTLRIDPRRIYPEYIYTLVACRWYYAAWRVFVPPEFLSTCRRKISGKYCIHSLYYFQ